MSEELHATATEADAAARSLDPYDPHFRTGADHAPADDDPRIVDARLRAALALLEGAFGDLPGAARWAAEDLLSAAGCWLNQFQAEFWEADDRARGCVDDLTSAPPSADDPRIVAARLRAVLGLLADNINTFSDPDRIAAADLIGDQGQWRVAAKDAAWRAADRARARATALGLAWNHRN